MLLLVLFFNQHLLWEISFQGVGGCFGGSTNTSKAVQQSDQLFLLMTNYCLLYDAVGLEP